LGKKAADNPQEHGMGGSKDREGEVNRVYLVSGEKKEKGKGEDLSKTTIQIRKEQQASTGKGGEQRGVAKKKKKGEETDLTENWPKKKKTWCTPK